MEQEIQIPIENKAKPKRIPKLRFQEFEGNWTISKLSDIAKIERGRFSPRPRNNPIYYGGNIPFVQTSDIVNSNGKISIYSQTLNDKGLKVSKQFAKGTILITIAANIGYAGVLQIDMACPDSLIGITCSDKTFNYFLNYQLEIEQPKMDYLAVSAAQKNINIDFLKPYIFNIPSLPEQQKIATFLSAVDKKIQQLTRKKELLETYKKGLMQQLFSQQLRFKDADGKDFPDWERKKLNEIAEKNSRKNTDDVVKFVLTNSATQGIVSQSDYFDRSIANVNNLQGYYVVEVNDFIYNPRISVHAPVGPIKRNKLKKGIMSPLYSVFKFNTGNLKYFEYYFETTTWHKYLNTVANFGARHDRMNITSSDFFKIPIPFPKLEEQQKIADFLSGIDTKIEAVTQQITKTQSFKKGLLQQMFV